MVEEEDTDLELLSPSPFDMSLRSAAILKAPTINVADLPLQRKTTQIDRLNPINVDCFGYEKAIENKENVEVTT